MNLSAEAIAHGVDDKARFSGGQWRCRCPVHQGANQNFYVRDGRSSIVLHCFAGCTFEELVDNLRSRGLWKEKSVAESASAPNYSKDQLEYYHLWCLTYRDNVRKGYQPTKEEDAKFRRLSTITYREGIAL